MEQSSDKIQRAAEMVAKYLDHDQIAIAEAAFLMCANAGLSARAHSHLKLLESEITHSVSKKLEKSPISHSQLAIKSVLSTHEDNNS